MIILQAACFVMGIFYLLREIIENIEGNRKSIKECKDIFLSERYKITTSQSIQDMSKQERAIVFMRDSLQFHFNRMRGLEKVWEEYKFMENKYREAYLIPGSVVIHYGKNKSKILNKMDEVISYLK